MNRMLRIGRLKQKLIKELGRVEGNEERGRVVRVVHELMKELGREDLVYFGEIRELLREKEMILRLEKN